MSLAPLQQYHQSLFQPDTVAGPAPAQVRSPVWMLSKAMLQRAIDDLQYPQQEPERDGLAGTRTAKHARRRQARGNVTVRAQAMAWLADEDDEYLFSFRGCCAVLGLAPDFVRRLIRAGAVVRDGRIA